MPDSDADVVGEVGGQGEAGGVSEGPAGACRAWPEWLWNRPAVSSNHAIEPGML